MRSHSTSQRDDEIDVNNGWLVGKRRRRKHIHITNYTCPTKTDSTRNSIRVSSYNVCFYFQDTARLTWYGTRQYCKSWTRVFYVDFQPFSRNIGRPVVFQVDWSHGKTKKFRDIVSFFRLFFLLLKSKSGHGVGHSFISSYFSLMYFIFVILFPMWEDILRQENWFPPSSQTKRESIKHSV